MLNPNALVVRSNRIVNENPNQLALPPRESENAQKAKVVADVVISGGCILANGALKDHAEEKCGCMQEEFRNRSIDVATTKVASATRKIAHQAIDADRCYGNGNSMVSRFTNWIRSWGSQGN